MNLFDLSGVFKETSEQNEEEVRRVGVRLRLWHKKNKNPSFREKVWDVERAV